MARLLADVVSSAPPRGIATIRSSGGAPAGPDRHVRNVAKGGVRPEASDGSVFLNRARGPSHRCPVSDRPARDADDPIHSGEIVRPRGGSDFRLRECTSGEPGDGSAVGTDGSTRKVERAHRLNVAVQGAGSQRTLHSEELRRIPDRDTRRCGGSAERSAVSGLRAFQSSPSAAGSGLIRIGRRRVSFAFAALSKKYRA